MIKTKLYFFTIGATAILLTSFQYSQDDSVKLREVMKTIKSEADEVRKTLLEGKSKNFDYTYHKQILTAKTRNKKASNPYFKTRAENYLQQLEKYNKAKDKKKSFNQLIDACISCHDYASKIYIGRIKKLYINE